MTLEIYPLDDGSGAWVVEYINPDDDGICEKATFNGPSAERQARAYLAMEYGATSKRQSA